MAPWALTGWAPMSDISLSNYIILCCTQGTLWPPLSGTEPYAYEVPMRIEGAARPVGRGALWEERSGQGLARHRGVCHGRYASGLRRLHEILISLYIYYILYVISILAVHGIYFLLFIENWVPSPQFLARTHPKRLIMVYS